MVRTLASDDMADTVADTGHALYHHSTRPVELVRFTLLVLHAEGRATDCQCTSRSLRRLLHLRITLLPRPFEYLTQ